MRLSSPLVLLCSLRLTTHWAVAQVADPGCDAAFDNLLLVTGSGPTCTAGADGTCPADCLSSFDDLHNACSGLFFTGTDDNNADEVTEYSPAALLGFTFFLQGDCEDAPVDWALSRDDLTCQDWLELNLGATFVLCETECTEGCKDILSSVYANCASTDTIEFEGEALTAIEFEDSFAFFRTDECTEFAETLTFMGAGDGATTMTPVMAPVAAMMTAAPIATTMAPVAMTAAPVATTMAPVAMTEAPVMAPDMTEAPVMMGATTTEAPAMAPVMDGTTEAPAMGTTETATEAPVAIIVTEAPVAAPADSPVDIAEAEAGTSAATGSVWSKSTSSLWTSTLVLAVLVVIV